MNGCDEDESIVDNNQELATLIRPYDEETNIEDALILTGPFGCFQFCVQIFFMYVMSTVAYQALISYFAGDSPPWKCRNNSSSQFCKDNFGKEFSVTSINFSIRCNMSREEWIYTTPIDYSYITEFELICNRNSIAALIGAIFFIGSGVGGLVSGIMSDVFGRKLTYGISLLIVCVCSICCSFVKEVWQLMLLRALLGAGQGSLVGLSFVYLVEFIPSTYRSLSSNIFQSGFTLSAFIIVGIGYFVRTWRDLQLYISFPGILALVTLIFIPESPRWLLVSGRNLKADAVLKQICNLNGKTHDGLKLKVIQPGNESNSKTKKYTYIDLFKKCEVAIIVLVQCFIWFADDLVFFGVTLSASDLGGNRYENFVFIALPDIPCCLITVYLCNRFGRKRTVLVSNLLSGIFIGAIAFFLDVNINYGYIYRVVLAVAGKCFCNFAFNGLFMWTFELFPTVVRSQGLSLCLVIARIGAAGAPFLTNVLEEVSPILPYVVMGASGVLASLIGLILPETRNSKSRENYDDFFAHKRSIIDASDFDYMVG